MLGSPIPCICYFLLWNHTYPTSEVTTPDRRFITLLTYCCVTNHPILVAKTTNTYYFTKFLRVSSLRGASVCGCDSGSFTSCSQTIGWGCSHLRASLELENLLPSSLAWLLVGFSCLDASVSYHLDFSIRLLIIKQLPSSKVRTAKERQRMWAHDVSLRILRLTKKKTKIMKLQYFTSFIGWNLNMVTWKRLKSLGAGVLTEAVWEHHAVGEENKFNM